MKIDPSPVGVAIRAFSGGPRVRGSLRADPSIPVAAGVVHNPPGFGARTPARDAPHLPPRTRIVPSKKSGLAAPSDAFPVRRGRLEGSNHVSEALRAMTASCQFPSASPTRRVLRQLELPNRRLAGGQRPELHESHAGRRQRVADGNPSGRHIRVLQRLPYHRDPGAKHVCARRPGPGGAGCPGAFGAQGLISLKRKEPRRARETKPLGAETATRCPVPGQRTGPEQGHRPGRSRLPPRTRPAALQPWHSAR